MYLRKNRKETTAPRSDRKMITAKVLATSRTVKGIVQHRLQEGKYRKDTRRLVASSGITRQIVTQAILDAEPQRATIEQAATKDGDLGTTAEAILAAEPQRATIEQLAGRKFLQDQAEQAKKERESKLFKKPESGVLDLDVPDPRISLQIFVHAARHHKGELHGYGFVNSIGSQETRIGKSYAIYDMQPVKDPATGKKSWEVVGDPRSSWLITDSYQQEGGAAARKKLMDIDSIGKLFDEQGGQGLGGQPKWYLEGSNPPEEHDTPTTRRIDLSDSLKRGDDMFDILTSLDDPENPTNLVGLSWRGKANTTFNNYHIERMELADGLSPDLECSITDYTTFVDQLGNDNEQWIEERRLGGKLVGVVVHNGKSIRDRMQAAFYPDSRAEDITKYGAQGEESVWWDMPVPPPTTPTPVP